MDNLSPDQIKSMIAMLQMMLNTQAASSNTSEPIEDEAEEESFSVLPTKSFRSKKDKNKPRPNKFNNMPEKNMHKEDIEIDQKLKVQPPVPRARPFRMAKVVCRVCGRNDEVNPSLLVEGPARYKCNQCSTSAG